MSDEAFKSTKGRNKKSKSTIHTTISDKSINILNKYLSINDDNNNLLYNSKAEIIEHALELLDKHYNPELQTVQTLWNRFRSELGMLAVGKTTFLAYISGDNQRAFKQNIAVDVVEWYKKRNISDLSLEDVLNALKDIWIAGNYFTKVEIEVGNKGSYQMYFYHNLRSKKYGEYWGQYFTEFLCNQKNCETELFIRNESFILSIIER